MIPRQARSSAIPKRLCLKEITAQMAQNKELVPAPIKSSTPDSHNCRQNHSQVRWQKSIFSSYGFLKHLVWGSHVSSQWTGNAVSSWLWQYFSCIFTEVYTKFKPSNLWKPNNLLVLSHSNEVGRFKMRIQISIMRLIHQSVFCFSGCLHVFAGIYFYLRKGHNLLFTCRKGNAVGKMLIFYH